MLWPPLPRKNPPQFVRNRKVLGAVPLPELAPVAEFAMEVLDHTPLHPAAGPLCPHQASARRPASTRPARARRTSALASASSAARRAPSTMLRPGARFNRAMDK